MLDRLIQLLGLLVAIVTLAVTVWPPRSSRAWRRARPRPAPRRPRPSRDRSRPRPKKDNKR